MYGLQGAALKAYMDSLLIEEVIAVRLQRSTERTRSVEALERAARALEKLVAMQYEVRNAIIHSARIVVDHGMLSAWVQLDYGGTVQGFGGYALYLPESFKHHDQGSGYAGHFLWRVMQVAGVEEWSELSGKTVRVRADHNRVHAIGHIVHNDWFDPKEEFRGGQTKDARHD